MKKTLMIFLSLMLTSAFAWAQDEEAEKPAPDAALLKMVSETPGLSIDTTFVKKYRYINNYSMIGVQYGVNLASASMNPIREMKSVFRPLDVSILYTRYCKMFGYMPYFGFQAGVSLYEQSYQFAYNEEYNIPSFTLLGAYGLKSTVVQAPFTAQMHYDFWKMKILVDLSFYAGYRLNVERYYDDRICRPDDTRRQWANSFHENERRFIYGFQGGGGIGFIFDPIEIHITAKYRYDLSYMYKPNISTYNFVEGADKSNYYYTWANPTNLVVSVGVHYQITRRLGSTHRQLRQEARRQLEEELRMSNEQSSLEAKPKGESEFKRTKVKTTSLIDKNERDSSEDR